MIQLVLVTYYCHKNHTANIGAFFLLLSAEAFATSMTESNDDTKTRYLRQIVIPSIGEEGQRKLGQARVLVIGAGGLGSPVLYYLAAAGVGTIGIADPDIVDLSNLQRQILYTTEDIGKEKTTVAAKRISVINPFVTVNSYPLRLTKENIDSLLVNYDIVVDCSDNFETRYVISDATMKAGKTMVYGAVYQFMGQVSVFNFKRGPSYRDLFPEEMHASEEKTSDPPGVIGPLPGIIGSIQACEVIKIIIGASDILSGRLLQIDTINLKMEIISL